MRKECVLLLLCLCGHTWAAPAPLPRPSYQDTELAKMQGRWDMMFHYDPYVKRNDSAAALHAGNGISWLIKHDKLICYELTEDGEEREGNTYMLKIYAPATRKDLPQLHVAYVFGARERHAVYKLEGNFLKMCYCFSWNTPTTLVPDEDRMEALAVFVRRR